MKYQRLADEGGCSPVQAAWRVRLLLALLAGAAVLLAGPLASGASAVALPTTYTTLPSTIPGVAWAMDQAGTVTLVGTGTAEVAAGGAGLVAAAPLLVAAPAVIAAGAGLTFAWAWNNDQKRQAMDYPAGVPVATAGAGGSIVFAGYNGSDGTSASYNVQVDAVYPSNAGGACSGTTCTQLAWQLLPPTTGQPTSGGNAFKVWTRCSGSGSGPVIDHLDVGDTPNGYIYNAAAPPYAAAGANGCLAMIYRQYGPGSSNGTAPTVLVGILRLGPSGSAVTGMNKPAGTANLVTTPTSTCSGGAVVAGTPVSYTSSTPSGSLPAFSLPPCPSGQSRTRADFPTTSDSTGTPTQTQPPISPWVAPTIPSSFPNCSASSCLLVLTRITPSGQRTNCQSAGYPCQGWMNQPRAGTGQTVLNPATNSSISEKPRTFPNGDTLECKWGAYQLTVDSCSTVPTEPNPNVDTDVPEGTVADAPSSGPAGDESLCELGWSFNPVDWVVQPLKCLFIPRQSVVQGAAQDLGDAWGGTAPGTVSSAVGDVMAPLGALHNDTGPSDCQGPAFVIPQLPTMPHALTLHPLSTCNELTTYLLGIYLPVATALIYIGGFFAGTRLVLKGFSLEGVDA